MKREITVKRETEEKIMVECPQFCKIDNGSHFEYFGWAKPDLFVTIRVYPTINSTHIYKCAIVSDSDLRELKKGEQIFEEEFLEVLHKAMRDIKFDIGIKTLEDA